MAGGLQGRSRPEADAQAERMFGSARKGFFNAAAKASDSNRALLRRSRKTFAAPQARIAACVPHRRLR